MSYCVYKHTVPNGKVYIGITSMNPLDRWGNGHGYKENKRFWNDIVLYGWLNITHEILQSGLNEYDARKLEARLICEYQSYKKEYGYNVQSGATYGYIENDHMSRCEYLSYCKSDEYKKKCVPKSARCKEVYQYNLNGEFIRKFDSIGEASRTIGKDKRSIRDCLKGKQKTCGGYFWSISPP